MAQASMSTPVASSWSLAPERLRWQKFMMWMFIVTDGLMFASFLASYGFARTAVSNWPNGAEVFQLWFISVMTFVLITSSATMATAVAAARRSDWGMAKNMVLATVFGGVVFLGMQAFEWSHLIEAGVSMSGNPYGANAFGNYFYLITGFHGTHVFTGLVVLSILRMRMGRGKSTDHGVELAGLYWHFVDLVWVFVFTLFYLV